MRQERHLRRALVPPDRLDATIIFGWYPEEVSPFCRVPRLIASRVVSLCVALGAAALAPLALPAVALATSARTSPATSPCRSDVRYGPLPTWARSGFSPPDQPISYVLGARGDIVAILWARHDPLLSPALPNRRNKILWVSRLDGRVGSNLQIRARRMVGPVPVGPVQTREVVGGPGPAGINMPAPGCWVFKLSWSGHTDSVALEYSARP
jgi:hypothetical protein